MDKYEKHIIKSLKQLRHDIKPNPVLEQKSWDMLFDSYKETFPQTTKISFNLYLYLRPVAVSLLVLSIIFVSGFSLIARSKHTVPGNFLYPVKLSAEKARMVLVFNYSKKTVLRAEILTNRLSEATILAEKVEKGNKELEPELQDLAKGFTSELRALKQQVAVQIPQGPEQDITPFPEQELLTIDEDQLIDQASLPIQDQRQIFTVIQTQELKQLLAETKDLLVEDNMVTALVRIEQAEKIVQEQEPKQEQDVSEQEVVQQEKDDQTHQVDETEKQTLPEQPVDDNLSGSAGQILQKIQPEPVQDFKVDIQKEVPVKTGMIRE